MEGAPSSRETADAVQEVVPSTAAARLLRIMLPLLLLTQIKHQNVARPVVNDQVQREGYPAGCTMGRMHCFGIHMPGRGLWSLHW